MNKMLVRADDLGYSEAEINDMIATGAVAIKRKM